MLLILIFFLITQINEIRLLMGPVKLAQGQRRNLLTHKTKKCLGFLIVGSGMPGISSWLLIKISPSLFFLKFHTNVPTEKSQYPMYDRSSSTLRLAILVDYCIKHTLGVV